MRSFAAIVLAALLATPAALAEKCVPTASKPELNSRTPAGEYYVDGDCSPVHGCPTDPLLGVWVYEESNGIPGLQRSDEVQDDTCDGLIEPDRKVL